MENKSVKRLAAILRMLVLLTFAVNLMCFLLVPGLAAMLLEGGPKYVLHYLINEVANGYAAHTLGHVAMYFAIACVGVWYRVETAFVAVFFWVCGTCTALILWQAKRVLDTILAEEPFQMSNALALKRAAICCWIISGGALVRLILWFWWEGTIYPLFTYTALFIPAFFMAGLLFLVMSALFRQAAELKEDQDLTI